MTDNLFPSQIDQRSLAERLSSAGAWTRLFGRDLFSVAAARLIELTDTCDDLHKRLAGQERAFAKERNAVLKEAKNLIKRTEMAIKELETYKKNLRTEVPVAVILSPSQYADLTCCGTFKNSKIAKLQIYVAKGVYGPVVLTQDAFNAFSRNAPELNLVAKRPSYEGDTW
jgi:hypothetical protein